MVWYSHLFQKFPKFVVVHTIKGFGIVNKAEVDNFLGLPWVFCDPVDIGNLISGSSAFSKSNLNIWKFSVQVLLKPCLENFEHYFTSVWDECNCAVVWTFFGIAFLPHGPSIHHSVLDSSFIHMSEAIHICTITHNLICTLREGGNQDLSLL